MTNLKLSFSWLEKLRQDALASFEQTGFPSPRAEEWRYTNVSAIEKKRFLPVSATAAAVDVQAFLMAYQLKEAWSLVLIDGRVSPELSLLIQSCIV
jgi:Fe-S cluster assembly protein SufD